MPNKKDPYASPAQKVLGLYSLFLFTGRKYSLPHLAELFHCSKQTVMRMIEQVERTQRIRIDGWMEGGRKWYRARTPQRPPNVTLDAEAIQHLLLCRDIVWHLLPGPLREDVSRTIEKTAVLLPEYEDRADALTTYLRAQPKGAVDYSRSQQTIDTLLRAMRERRVCEMAYRAPGSAKAKALAVAPYRFISFREGLYVRCRLEKALAEPEKYYDATYAVQRIAQVAATDRRFEPIVETGSAADGAFGFGVDAPFRVVADISPAAAAYVRERVWSRDQAVTPNGDGGLTLEFTATSRQEVLAWVFGFSGEAVLRAPEDLRGSILERLDVMKAKHGRGPRGKG